MSMKNSYSLPTRIGLLILAFQLCSVSAFPQAVKIYDTLAKQRDVTLTLSVSGNLLYFNGTKWVNTAPTTSIIPEGSSLYFTNARAIAAPLTGFTSGAGTVTSSDSILGALQKINGNVAANTSAIALAPTLAGANTFTGQNTFAAGTITTSQPATWTQTWNAGGITFTGLKLNVTDTASAAASLLMDLQVGAVSKLTVGKEGTITSAGSTAASLALTATADNDTGIFFPGSNIIGFAGAGTERFRFSPSVLTMSSGVVVGWSSNTTSSGTVDLALVRDAANTLAQRNSTNAQTSRVYTSFTARGAGTTNLEALETKGVASGSFIIQSIKGSAGGTARDIELRHGATDTNGVITNGTLIQTITATGVTNSGTLAVTGNSTYGGDITTTAVGKTLAVKSGTNSKAGTFTLVAGVAVVSNTSITANSVVVVTLKTLGGTRTGNPDCVPVSGTGFTATGASTDTSTYNFIVVEVN